MNSGIVGVVEGLAALVSGLGWVAIVLFQITIFSLQMHKGIADPPAG